MARGRPVGSKTKINKFHLERITGGNTEDLGDFKTLSEIAQLLELSYQQVRRLVDGHVKLANSIIITKL